MRFQRLSILLIVAVALIVAGCGEHPRFANANANVPEVTGTTPTPKPEDEGPKLDVPYVPTPNEVVEEMLSMAGVKKGDILYDLGSGDGRIPITAAKRFGTKGVGIDLDPVRVKEAKENAEREKVTELVKFIEGDIFKEDFSEATVVTLYLLPQVNLKLKPELLKMKPGTRVVSHNYDMGDWKPENSKKLTINGRDHYVYFWRVPEAKAEEK
jgi:hypothetical protein